MKFTVVFLSVLFLVSCVHEDNDSEALSQSFGSIKGTIINISAGTRLSEARITVGDKDVQLDEDETFYTDNIVVGKATILVEIPGYYESVTSINIISGQTVLLEIELTSTWPPIATNVEPDSYGVIIGSPVEGLRYISGDHHGRTDLDGKFGYTIGNSIKFYVGDILIGEVESASNRITPLEISNNDSWIALNILRFLQTIDDDGDPNNGIQISDAIHQMASSQTLDFSDSNWNQSPSFLFETTAIEKVVLELTSVTIAGARYPIWAYDAYSYFASVLDGMIDSQENELLTIASQSECEVDAQCSIAFLETKSIRYCPPWGPRIAYSVLNIDQQSFDLIVDERDELINIKSRIESVADSGNNITGACFRTPFFNQASCNILNRCEIIN